MSKKLTTEEFIFKAKSVHGSKYDYSDVIYINNHTKIIIGCNKHGVFEILPNNHISKYNKNGCPECHYVNLNLKFKMGVKIFTQRSHKIHKNIYDYSKVKYLNARKKVIIICQKHGDFLQTPFAHLRGDGCRTCGYEKNLRNSNSISKVEVEFLKYIKIPKKHRSKYICGYIVDGYDPKTNTIYEFLGDYWHGNPEKYNGEEINHNTYPPKKFKTLYDNTFRRFSHLKNHGHNIKYIWENDWYKFKKRNTPTPHIMNYE